MFAVLDLRPDAQEHINVRFRDRSGTTIYASSLTCLLRSHKLMQVVKDCSRACQAVTPPVPGRFGFQVGLGSWQASAARVALDAGTSLVSKYLTSRQPFEGHEASIVSSPVPELLLASYAPEYNGKSNKSCGCGI